MKARKKSSTEPKWDDTLYVSIYELARNDLSDTAIAAALQVSKPTMIRWKKSKPAVADALKRGRQAMSRTSAASFARYLYNRLSPELRAVHDRLHEWQNEPDGPSKVEKLLASKGKNARQFLFLQALVANRFNVTKACAFVGVPWKTFEYWSTEDPDFASYLQETMMARKDAFEEMLYAAAESGSEGAMILANKTLNRDRGYGDKIEVEHSGTVNHRHAVLDLNQLNLPTDVRMKIIEAARTQGLIESDAA